MGSQSFPTRVAVGCAHAKVHFIASDDTRFPDGLWAAGDIFLSLVDNIQESFGLTPIESPYKRLLNGGNEIEFYRSLKVGEKAIAEARYADVQLKQGSSGKLLLVVIETKFTTEGGELLLINRQTLIWR